MAPAPLVTIVIDNYNYAAFVGTAIRSALDQTYPDLEIVVVDDGSTDGSRAVIESFGDAIRTVFQENRGQSGAFNAGFAAARGEIVLFLDADDALRRDAVATVVDHWHDGVVKAQFCLATVDAGGKFMGNVFPTYPPGLTSERIRREALRTGLYPCPPTSGNAYARSFLERMMPLAPVFAGADGPLNTVAPLYGEVVTIDEPLGYYRIHGRNDGAQNALAADKFARFIRHDRDRIDIMRRHAAQLGLDIDGDPLDRAVLHLQYRLASLKLRPEDHPVPESVAGVTMRAVSAALGSGDRLGARAFNTLWFATVAVAPRRLAERLIAYRFVPSSRPAALRNALQRIGVLRRPAADAAGGRQQEGGRHALDLPS